MENLLQLENFLTVLLWLCGGVVAVAGAVAVVVKFWKWAHKQSDENATTLDEIMTWLASDKHRIEDLEKKQDEVDKQNKMLLKGVMQLMNHELDGNHTEQLTSARDEIQNYLFER